MNTIYVLWLRQLKKSLRSKSRIIGGLSQPIIFLFAFGFGFSSIFQKAGEGNYIQFLVPGIIAMSVLFSSVFSGIDVIWDRQFGSLKETLVAPVSRMEIMIGRTLGGATISIFQGFVILLVSTFLGFKIESLMAVLGVLLFVFLIAVMFTSFGTAIASVLEDMQGFQLIMNFLIMPLFFLSGAMFSISGLPNFMKTLVKINPLSYGVDGIRGVLTGIYQFGFAMDLMVLLAVTSIFLIIGSYLFSKIEV
ncbi:MAG: ABC transporter permease [Candidatus Moranbacteria bacterium]|nr:ABC transporter permease [Candidatus Moranbacteria bacterium]